MVTTRYFEVISNSLKKMAATEELRPIIKELRWLLFDLEELDTLESKIAAWGIDMASCSIVGIDLYTEIREAILAKKGLGKTIEEQIERHSLQVVDVEQVTEGFYHGRFGDQKAYCGFDGCNKDAEAEVFVNGLKVFACVEHSQVEEFQDNR